MKCVTTGEQCKSSWESENGLQSGRMNEVGDNVISVWSDFKLQYKKGVYLLYAFIRGCERL